MEELEAASTHQMFHIGGQVGMNFTESQHTDLILLKLSQQRQTGKYCDVTFHVDGHDVTAHRCVMAACSPYFESSCDNQSYTHHVNIINCKVDTFVNMLDYVYTGKIVIDKDSVGDILRLANQYMIVKLKAYCSEYLERNLTTSNCYVTKAIAEACNLNTLVKSTESFILAHITDIVQQSEIVSFPEHRFELFLSNKTIPLTEEMKFELLLRWIQHDFSERQGLLHKLLGHIQWKKVNANDIYSCLRENHVFRDNKLCMYVILQVLEENKMLSPMHHSFLQHFQKKICADPYQDSFNLDALQLPDYYISQPSQVKQFSDSSINQLEKVFHVTQPSDFDGLQAHLKDTGDRLLHESDKILHITQQSEYGISQAQISQESVGCRAEKIHCELAISPSDEQVSAIPNKIEAFEDEEIPEDCDEMLPSVPESSDVLSSAKDNEKENTELAESTLDTLDVSRIITIQPIVESQPSSESANKNITIKLKLSKSKAKLNTKKRKKGRQSKGLRSEIRASKKFCAVSLSDGTPEAICVKTIKQSCSKCEFSTQDADRMERHYKQAHSDNRIYTCSVCNFNTMWNREFYKHMKLHFHGPPFHCNQEGCGWSGERIQQLILHQMVHTDERPFACSVCNMKFRTKYNLTTHMKSHTGEKPFTCPMCSKCFATKGTLEQHRVTHSDARPYLCDTCGFSTKYQSHLIAHRRIHSGDVYCCQYPNCKYSTPKRSQLACHMRCHLSIRTHVCSTCGRGFVERGHLVRHERIHLDAKPFACKLCDYSSTRRDKLKEHELKYHTTTEATSAQHTPYKARKTRRAAFSSGGSGDQQPAELEQKMHQALEDRPAEPTLLENQLRGTSDGTADEGELVQQQQQQEFSALAKAFVGMLGGLN